MIDAAISSVVKELSPAKGDDLTAWEYEICNFFDVSDAIKYELDGNNFVSYELNKKNRECMFTVYLKATNKARDIHDVCNGLIKGWNHLYYTFFQSSLVEIYRNCTILKFVTVIDEGQFYVTGKAVVNGKRYRKLAKMYESTEFCEKLNKYSG